MFSVQQDMQQLPKRRMYGFFVTQSIIHHMKAALGHCLQFNTKKKKHKALFENFHWERSLFKNLTIAGMVGPNPFEGSPAGMYIGIFLKII
jgi:hypothetical protein